MSPRERSTFWQAVLPGRSLPSVVAFGGGHGLSSSLTALRRITDQLTAIVTVADDGGSSGRLRDELNCLPPGDLRMALAALCGDDESGRTWADVLQYRFNSAGPLADHAIGNLLIAGLWERLGDPVAGLDMVARLLGAKGRVLPMASVPLDIEADVIGLDPDKPDEHSEVRGQATVAKTPGEVMLRPAQAGRPAGLSGVDRSGARRRLDRARSGVLVHLGDSRTCSCPSWPRPSTRTRGPRILTLNLEPAGETAGFSAAKHIELLADHAPDLRLDVVLADSGFASDDPHLAAWADSLGAQVVVADLAARDGSPRHDPLRLASAYAEIMGI